MLYFLVESTLFGAALLVCAKANDEERIPTDNNTFKACFFFFIVFSPYP
ncbi:hypothetical protein EMIT0180MI3_11857 [Priestia megaterium]